MYCNLKELEGKIPKAIERTDDSIKFAMSDGSKYVMEHHQDCCEGVYLEDVTGDLEDLIGLPIQSIDEEQSNDLPPKDGYGSDSYTWSFYHIRNIKASLTFRWFGSSNGYYSETAGIYRYE